MSDKMRGEFEEWAKTELIDTTKYGTTGVYCHPDAHRAWQAWQASRQALVVELPPQHDVAYRAYDSVEIRHALKDAGIKWKE